MLCVRVRNWVWSVVRAGVASWVLVGSVWQGVAQSTWALRFGDNVNNGTQFAPSLLRADPVTSTFLVGGKAYSAAQEQLFLLRVGAQGAPIDTAFLALNSGNYALFYAKGAYRLATGEWLVVGDAADNGTFERMGWIAKINLAGNSLVWTRTYKFQTQAWFGSFATFSAVVRHPVNTAFVLAGGAAIQSSQGYVCAVLVQTDTSGQNPSVLTQLCGNSASPFSAFFADVRVTSDTHFLAVGRYTLSGIQRGLIAKVDMSGNVVWATTIGQNNVYIDLWRVQEVGGYYVAAGVAVFCGGGGCKGDPFLIGVNPANGTIVWHKVIKESNLNINNIDESAFDVVVLPSGNAGIVAYTGAYVDPVSGGGNGGVLFVEIQPGTGTIVQAHAYDMANTPASTSLPAVWMDLASDGAPVMTVGTTHMVGEQEVLLFKVDTTGAFLCNVLNVQSVNTVYTSTLSSPLINTISASNYNFNIQGAPPVFTGFANVSGAVIPYTPLISSITATDPLCAGDTTGAITLSVVPGNVQTVWTNSAGDTIASGTLSVNQLGADTYTVEITHPFTGCQTFVNVILDEPAPLTIQGTVTDATCAELNNGAIDITVSGGTPGYQYTWLDSNQNVIDTAQDLAWIGGGTYTVIVTDANGCSDTMQFTVQAPPPLIVTIQYDSASQTLTAQASGGTPPYQYSWNTGETGQTLSVDSSGTYIVYATDANGCIDTASYTVTLPATGLVVQGDAMEDGDVVCALRRLAHTGYGWYLECTAPIDAATLFTIDGRQLYHWEVSGDVGVRVRRTILWGDHWMVPEGVYMLRVVTEGGVVVEWVMGW